MTDADKMDLVLYRLDELKEDLGEFRADVKAWQDDHETRLRSLEKHNPQSSSSGQASHSREYWASIVAFATALAAFATAFWKAFIQ